MIRVIVTGDRRWPAVHVAETVCRRLQVRYGRDSILIVHGACPTGVDAAFEDVARRMKIATEPHPADWSKGRRAGPDRNREICEAGAAFCIAVHRALPRSRGSRSCVEWALACAIPCWWIADNSVRPVRVLGFSGFEVQIARRKEPATA